MSIMSIGTTFTQNTTFGVSSGPSYTGAKSVGPGTNGNADILLDAPVAHYASPSSNPVTIYGESIDYTKVTAFGFKAVLTSLNGNVSTPSVTVTFTGGLSGPTDLSYVLLDGQQVSVTANPLTADPSAIKVTPDATSDFEIQGIVHIDVDPLFTGRGESDSPFTHGAINYVHSHSSPGPHRWAVHFVLRRRAGLPPLPGRALPIGDSRRQPGYEPGRAAVAVAATLHRGGHDEHWVRGGRRHRHHLRGLSPLRGHHLGPPLPSRHHRQERRRDPLQPRRQSPGAGQSLDLQRGLPPVVLPGRRRQLPTDIGSLYYFAPSAKCVLQVPMVRAADKKQIGIHIELKGNSRIFKLPYELV